MLIEINEQELENLETSVNAAIKFSAFMQVAAITSKDFPLKIDDILRANMCLAQSDVFIKRAKKEMANGKKENSTN